MFMTPEELGERFHADLSDETQFELQYNAAPMQKLPVIVGNPRSVEWFRWGLIPAWAKDASIGNKLINARSETILEKPSFRSAFKSRRCIVPSNGFYEWQSVGKSKIPGSVSN